MKCKHEWMWLLPTVSEMSIDVFIETLGDSVIRRSVICSLCGCTGHKINSNRSGIRVHTSPYFLNKANELAAKYHFKIGQRSANISSK
jgi:hypothetical protein